MASFDSNSNCNNEIWNQNHLLTDIFLWIKWKSEAHTRNKNRNWEWFISYESYQLECIINNNEKIHIFNWNKFGKYLPKLRYSPVSGGQTKPTIHKLKSICILLWPWKSNQILVWKGFFSEVYFFIWLKIVGHCYTCKVLLR